VPKTEVEVLQEVIPNQDTNAHGIIRLLGIEALEVTCSQRMAKLIQLNEDMTFESEE